MKILETQKALGNKNDDISNSYYQDLQSKHLKINLRQFARIQRKKGKRYENERER